MDERIEWLTRQAKLARDIEQAYLRQREGGRWTRQAERMLQQVRDNRMYFEREVERLRWLRCLRSGS